jgi:RNA polymerase sigma factor (sigma-70 family)
MESDTCPSVGGLSTATDEELMAIVRAGRQALDVLAHLYQQPLSAWFRRAGLSEDDAERTARATFQKARDDRSILEPGQTFWCQLISHGRKILAERGLAVPGNTVEESERPAASASQEDTHRLRVLRHGDSALEELYERYKPKLITLARSKGADDGTAEDDVQETFRKVWGAAETFELGRKFWPWIYTIFQNTIKDRQRRDTMPDQGTNAAVSDAIDKENPAVSPPLLPRSRTSRDGPRQPLHVFLGDDLDGLVEDIDSQPGPGDMAEKSDPLPEWKLKWLEESMTPGERVCAVLVPPETDYTSELWRRVPPERLVKWLNEASIRPPFPPPEWASMSREARFEVMAEKFGITSNAVLQKIVRTAKKLSDDSEGGT